MAMLAEKRSKQKWSEDPRNTAWSNDKDRYGFQMLEKMGWADGKGLGRKQHGTTSHVKIKKRQHNLGLGAKQSHDKDWLAHQEDFNNLLSALHQHGGNAELRSEEENKKAMLEVAKASKKRVFYKKFIHSKDTSKYSDKDMACIFGKSTTQSAPVTPQTLSDKEDESDGSTASCPSKSSKESGFVTYTSKQSIQDYFAQKMGEMKAAKEKQDMSNSEEIKHDSEEIRKEGKKKKRKKLKIEIDNEMECHTETGKVKADKKARGKIEKVDSHINTSCTLTEENKETKRKKKRKTETSNITKRKDDSTDKIKSKKRKRN